MKYAICAILFWSFVSHAQNAPAPSTETTVEEKERVKKRLYPGGRDEDNLQVQSQLPENHRMVTDEPADPADHD